MPDSFTPVLAAVIDTLPPPQRVLLALLVDWDLTLADIAQVLDVPLTLAAALQRDLWRTLLQALQQRWNTAMAPDHALPAAACSDADAAAVP